MCRLVKSSVVTELLKAIRWSAWPVSPRCSIRPALERARGSRPRSSAHRKRSSRLNHCLLGRACAAVVDDGRQHVIERMFGSPAEHLAGPIGIADNDRNVVGAVSRGIMLDGYPDATFRYQIAENVRYSAGHTRRDVE